MGKPKNRPQGRASTIQVVPDGVRAGIAGRSLRCVPSSGVNTACFSLSLVFDQLDVVSYEEVVRLPAFKRKTLVLIGIFSLLCHLEYISAFLFLFPCLQYVTSLTPSLKKKKTRAVRKKRKQEGRCLGSSMWSRYKEFSESLPGLPWVHVTTEGKPHMVFSS